MLNWPGMKCSVKFVAAGFSTHLDELLNIHLRHQHTHEAICCSSRYLNSDTLKVWAAASETNINNYYYYFTFTSPHISLDSYSLKNIHGPKKVLKAPNNKFKKSTSAAIGLWAVRNYFLHNNRITAPKAAWCYSGAKAARCVLWRTLTMNLNMV